MVGDVLGLVAAGLLLPPGGAQGRRWDRVAGGLLAVGAGTLCLLDIPRLVGPSAGADIGLGLVRLVALVAVTVAAGFLAVGVRGGQEHPEPAP